MPPPSTIESPARVRPFLKWEGGKRQLLAELSRFVPARFEARSRPCSSRKAEYYRVRDTQFNPRRRAPEISSTSTRRMRRGIVTEYVVSNVAPQARKA
jgi:hypothetical protein